MKSERQAEKILAGIKKNVKKKRWSCILSDCSEKAINSHIYQQKGVLDTIAYKGHLCETKPIDIFRWEKKKVHEILKIKKTGISKAISYPVFCTHHDITIFSEIETHPINLEKHKNQLLFFLRTIYSVKRKTQIVLEEERRLSKSSILNGLYFIPHDKQKLIESINIKNDLIKTHDIEIKRIENDLSQKQGSFLIKKFEYELIKVCSISTMLSPISKNYIYTNIFPYQDKTIVLIGTYSKNTDGWTKKYIESWNNLDKTNFEIRLTTYLSLNSENWCLSPQIVKKIRHRDLKKFYALNSRTITNTMSLKSNLLLDLDFRTEFNFFANNNYGN